MRKLMILLALCLGIGGSNAYCKTDWKLKKENSTIKVYSARVENSNFNAVKVECTVKGRLAQVVAALLDISGQHEWVFNSKVSKLLQKVGDNELIYYSEVTVPWPCSNRDLVGHLTVTQPKAGVVTIESHAEPDFAPVASGLVRIRSSQANWTLTAAANGLIQIDYVLQFDPAGAVPAWLTNMFVTRGPYETFLKLQEQMDQPAYKDAAYSFARQ